MTGEQLDKLTPLQRMREAGLSYTDATPETKDFTVRGVPARARGWLARQGERFLRLGLLPYSEARVQSPDADIYYLGHHKCATNWMRAFLLRLSRVIQFDYIVKRGQRFKDFQAWRTSHVIVLNVNADVETMKAVPTSARAFHLVRDPRDALVSEYFSRKFSHGVHNQWHVELRRFLHDHSLEEGLIYLMDQHIYFMQMEGWVLHGKPHILDVKYEDLLEDEIGGFARILNHLGVGVSDRLLGRIVRKCSFESLSGGRKRGAEDKTKHFRKGVAGDWKNHMPPDGRVYKMFVERFGDLMKRLGYEV